MTATIESEPKARTRKPTEAERFAYEGEFLDVEPTDPRYAQVIALKEAYRTRALALHEAKEAAFKAEDELKEFMGGYENLRVNGEVIVTWRWKLKTVFDKRQLQRDNPALVEQYTVRTPDGTRAFDAKGVVGVD